MILARAEELRQNALAIQQRIDQACCFASRDPQTVKLVWVSKTKPIEDVEAAIQAGAMDFGENRIQECLEKFSAPREMIQLHVIGPVQSNKWRKAAQLAHWIHSVDSLPALQKYQDVCLELGKTLDVLIQVNTSGEITKSGLDLSNAASFLESLPNLSQIRYRGLMTIGIHSGVAEDARAGFAALRSLRDSFKGKDPRFQDFSELSMGMTDDLEVAIAEGATMVRVGTALFGSRNYTSEVKL